MRAATSPGVKELRFREFMCFWQAAVLCHATETIVWVNAAVCLITIADLQVHLYQLPRHHHDNTYLLETRHLGYCVRRYIERLRRDG